MENGLQHLLGGMSQQVIESTSACMSKTSNRVKSTKTLS